MHVTVCVLLLEAVLWKGLVREVAVGVWQGMLWWLAKWWLWLGAVTGIVVGLGGGGV
jgi:hypothetical protein